MRTLLLLIVLIPAISSAQYLPKANTITIKGVTFKEVCTMLLDSNFVIDKKDNDLQTVSTEYRDFPKHWNAQYSISVRVKDSVAYFTAPTKSPLGNWVAFNHVNKKGITHPKGSLSYPFLLLIDFVKSFGKELEFTVNPALP